MVSPCGDDFF